MPVTELENRKLSARDAKIEEIASRMGVRSERGRRFAELTSLRVGGAIDWVISPETEEQAAAVVHALDEAGISWRALGSGSNVLADDADHHYVVVSLKDLKGEARFDGERVSVSAGYSLPRLCIDAGRRGLAGIEGLGGIPGTVGGALWMNAGAYEHEIGTVTETVRVAREGKVVEVAGSEVEWNYRHTSFREGELLLGATLRLRPDDPDKIGARMKEAKNKRLATQPHGARSAGCFFKNPPGSQIGTGKMIDEMGMKGERRGGALVSPVHANFIVTDGDNARASDALALAEEIRERVRRERGIELEYEVELWSAAEAEESQASEAGSREPEAQSQEAETSGESNAVQTADAVRRASGEETS
ncbi:MAG: UDP-N-acetylmuramate dehydrogenase [Blastocatellia bacterium]|jgi:UDP-N-acetylmuramate dehydrogenase|nr:UDP-N-acetylmuramate dehydrogenase [Blastocatellia bacterium]